MFRKLVRIHFVDRLRRNAGTLSRKSRVGERKLWGWLFVTPSLLGVVVFYLIPFGDVVRRSFVRALDGRFAGLMHYRQVLGNEAFCLAAQNTIRFVVVCLPLLLCISLGVAVLLQKMVRGREVLKSAYLLPLAIPAASIVLLWQILFDRQGIWNAVLASLHLPARDWMNTDASFWVLVFTYLWKNMGYDVILWLAGLNGISRSIYEAAYVDGAGERQCFWYITLPSLRPVAFTIVVLSLLNSFKVFREAYLVAGNYPQDKIYMLQHVFNNWFSTLSVDKMAAGSVLLCIVVSVFVLLLQRSWSER